MENKADACQIKQIPCKKITLYLVHQQRYYSVGITRSIPKRHHSHLYVLHYGLSQPKIFVIYSSLVCIVFCLCFLFILLVSLADMAPFRIEETLRNSYVVCCTRQDSCRFRYVAPFWQPCDQLVNYISKAENWDSFLS